MSGAAEDSPNGEPGTFRRMVETLPLSLYADRPGDLASFSYVSPQVEAMFGYSARTVARRLLLHAHPPSG